MERNEEVVVQPLGRELARELTREEISRVSGGDQTATGTIAWDRMLDPIGDRWNQE